MDRYAILCGGCLLWVHKKCSGVKIHFAQTLSLDAPDDAPDDVCQDNALLIDGRMMREMLVGDNKVSTEFCHLSDVVSVGTTESWL